MCKLNKTAAVAKLRSDPQFDRKFRLTKSSIVNGKRNCPSPVSKNQSRNRLNRTVISFAQPDALPRRTRFCVMKNGSPPFVLILVVNEPQGASPGLFSA